MFDEIKNELRFVDSGAINFDPEPVPSHIKLTAGDDGDIFFCSNGQEVSLTNLIELASALGYDITSKEDKDDKQCDYEGAMSLL